MPPRRSARLVELANPHFQLPFPPNVVALLFSLLPLDARLRAREVCRGWRFFLEDVSLWQYPDFSEAAAESPTVVLTWGLARAACARAKGTLHTLNLRGMLADSLAALVELVAENGESLRSLLTPYSLVLGAENVERLRQAAPLCVLNCPVKCSGAEVAALLRCELVCPYYLWVDDLDTQQQQTDFVAALAKRTGIEVIALMGGNLAGGAMLEDLARAIVFTGAKTTIAFGQCGLTPLARPARTLLLRSNVSLGFIIDNHGEGEGEGEGEGVPLFTGPDLPAFCDALRSNTKLNQIMLDNCYLWADPAAAGMVLAALAARSTLFTLTLHHDRVGETQAQQFTAGTQLTQLITVGWLNDLLLKQCSLGEVGLAPIFAALSVATRLERLDLTGEEMSSAFARDAVLPAVRANTSLRKLAFSNVDGDELLPELIEAQNIVAARAA